VPRSIYEVTRDMARQTASSWEAAPRDDCARKLKCCSPISNAFYQALSAQTQRTEW
jgi:hypothetical protein